jgi:hypothetical protein
MPDAVARKLQTAIAGIFTPSDAAFSQVLLHFAPVYVNQRADDSIRGYRANAGEAGGPGTSKKSEKYRFRLVCPRMTHGYAVYPAGCQLFPEKLQPRLAPCLFQIPSAAQVRAPDVDAKSTVQCQVPNKFGVRARFLTAQPVVQVQHAKAQIPLWRQFAQHVQKTHRIRTAGYRHSHASASMKHAVALDGLYNAREQKNSYVHCSRPAQLANVNVR